jgi:hypothetical protein
MFIKNHIAIIKPATAIIQLNKIFINQQTASLSKIPF